MTRSTPRSASRLLAGILLLSLAPVWLAAAEEVVTLFVTSEKNDVVSVYRGPAPNLVPVATIKVGREPHNLGISPDGRWVATSDRRSGEVSVIDTLALGEAARLKLGRQTHDVAFTSDSRTLFVGHGPRLRQRGRRELGGKAGAPGRPRAARLSITPDDRELWFTVTNRPQARGRAAGGGGAASGKVTLIDTGANAHDVTLSPDGRSPG
jgi:hypothetical protein